ncbi:MAG: hypothetical protein DDT21_01673 [Syntrophomonadaceae bacterium]|nr:hypothetical protein [Bacillota bacterium]
MPALLKYSFLALGGRLFILVIYLLFSLATHLFVPALPEFLRQSALLVVWFILSFINFMIIVAIVTGRGLTLLHTQYQQIPHGPGKLIASHLVTAFAVVSIFITAWVSFYPFASNLMPAGATLLVAVNIFSFSLYVASISLIVLMLGLALHTVGRQRGAAFLAFSAMFLVICLLVFPVNLNPLGLVWAPIAGLTEGTAIPGDTLLQTPWDAAWRNIILTTAALILQYMSLTYLLSGRIDVD